jgi:thiol-disulfide isomerase/thioredoxin
VNKTAAILVIAGLAALLGGYQARQLVSKPTTATQNLPLPPFSLNDLNGKQHAISEWQNKIRVINFWATWCPPCLKEMPTFNALNQEYAEKGVQFIGIALDDPDQVREFVAKNRITYPILLGGDNGTELARSLGNILNTVPFTVFVDQSDQIVKTHMGELSQTEIVAIIRSIQ